MTGAKQSHGGQRRKAATATARQRLEASAQEIGATVDWLRPAPTGGVHDITMVSVDAPDGKVWSASGTHSIVESFRSGAESNAARAVVGLLADIADGVEPCPTPDCDECCSTSREQAPA